MTKPRGRGGVATVAERLARTLGPGVRLLLVGRRGGEVLGVRALARDVGRVGARLRRGDLLHVHTSLRTRALLRDGAQLGIARARGVATVLQVHGWDRALVDRRPAWVRRLLLAADGILVVDPAAAQALRRWGIHADVIDNPWDPTSVRPRAMHADQVLFLGRLCRAKGVLELVDAFGTLLRHRPAARLVVAGTGPMEAAMHRRVAEAGLSAQVDFVGWVRGAQRGALLAAAAALVLPSCEEAAPLVVIEALAAGVPVVATATGRTRELVGQAGVVVPVGDPEAVARALEVVLDRPALGEHGPAQVAHCHPERIASQLWDVYRTLGQAA